MAVTYDLKDFEIFNNSKSFDHFVWIPDKTYIVIGRANNTKDSVKIEEAVKDEIQILKRPSGGEAVILSPKTIVISVKLKTDDHLKSHKYFNYINSRIISALEKEGINNLGMKGISDISLKDKKILGSSIYNKSDIVFYHAVLNVSESADVIDKYLKHPKKEPDYRKGRSHKMFVTSLNDEGYYPDVLKLSETINVNLEDLKNNYFKN